jgi:TatD DNase family protein
MGDEMFVDTHCHLDHGSLLSRLPQVLAAARLAGVAKFVVPGVDPHGWDGIANLAAAEQGIFPAFGIHPLHASCWDDAVLDRLALCARHAVAIGEIGLDYTISGASRQHQQAVFREQIRLARRLDLPVLLHCRRAFQDLVRIVKEERAGDAGGIMHAFSGSLEIASDCIRAGFHISLAGPVTYRNAVKPVEIAARLPLERMVLETDAPDMTPEPHRGRGNEPAFLVETALRVAQIRGVSLEALAAATTANAERLLRI